MNNINMKCKICKSETRIIFDEKNNVSYFYCSNCEFISKDDKAFISVKEQKKRYLLHENSIEDPRYVKYFKTFLKEAVFNYACNIKKSLDFGSGPSPVLAQILKRDYDIDVDIYDLFFQKEKVYINKKYDLITMTEVAEHLEDPLKYFFLLKQLLKKNAILAVMTKFHKNDDLLFLNWHYIRDESHISFFTPKTFEYIAKCVGLIIVYHNDKAYITFKNI